jgi:hypothetical protein
VANDEQRNARRIMFAILRDDRHPHAPHEVVYFDLLSESESETEFERLQRVDVLFSGYVRSTDGAPEGLAPETRQVIAAVVARLNRGERLSPIEIRCTLASVLI